MLVNVSVRYSLLDGTECRGPVYCLAHTTSTRSISPVGIQVYTSNTTRSIYIYYRVLFQDFTLRSISRLPTEQGTAGMQTIPWRVFHSSMLQYFQVLYSQNTRSPRRNWPSVVLLTYPQYSQYYGLQYYSNTLSTRSTK